MSNSDSDLFSEFSGVSLEEAPVQSEEDESHGNSTDHDTTSEKHNSKEIEDDQSFVEHSGNVTKEETKSYDNDTINSEVESDTEDDNIIGRRKNPTSEVDSWLTAPFQNKTQNLLVKKPETTSTPKVSALDASIIGRRQKTRKTIIYSDESDAELEYERRALSPSTRRSIGVVVAQCSDESEIEEEKESSDKNMISRRYECRKLDELKHKKEVLEQILLNRSALPDKGNKVDLELETVKQNILLQQLKLENLQIDENKNLKTSLRSVASNDSGSIEVYDQSHDATGELHSIEEEPPMKSLNSQPAEDVLHPTPSAINIELMDHQKHGLAWMMWREKNKPRGGILADDMGLGKTLSMISLIVKKLESDENEQEDDQSDSDLDESEGWHGKGRRTHYNGGTLVVCPASLLGQWKTEVATRVRRNTVSMNVHYGSSRQTKAKYLAQEDVVVTTYNIVTAEFNSDAALFGVKWRRIILDEATVIRNHKTTISQACSALRGQYRWVLSGTPICNEEMDIYAFLRFLRVKPYDDLDTYKGLLEDKKGGGGPRKHELMKTMMLRRTKEMLRSKNELTLPDEHIHDIKVHLNESEKNVYSKVLIYSRTLFTEYLEYYAQDTNVPQLLTLLLRLRQICDHPGLIQAMLVEGEDLELSEYDMFTSLHEDDLIKQLEAMDPQIFNLENPSSKITKVMELFTDKVHKTGEKAIFVSQWTSVLKLFEPFLNTAGVKFVSYTGEVPVKKRGEIIEKFNTVNTNAPQVMLLSLTVGGGLHLSVANHLFMIDCHWNPELENQAQGRVYRIGQKREVHFYKFFTSDSIEERIKVVQQKKLDLANSVITGAKNSGSKLTIEDFKLLFEVGLPL